MRSSRRDSLRQRWRRQGAVILSLLAYLVVTLGLPLPVSSQKSGDQPFPCQDHACGCQSADQCWRGCCCFTPEERWTWAKDHHVDPPAFAEKPDAQGWRSRRLRDLAGEKVNPTARCAHCEPKSPESDTPKTCCSPKPLRKNCCIQAKAESPDRKSTSSKSPWRWRMGWSVLHCQGLSLLWISAGAILPCPPRNDWQPIFLPGDWLCYSVPMQLVLGTSPPTPPPRLS